MSDAGEFACGQTERGDRLASESGRGGRKPRHSLRGAREVTRTIEPFSVGHEPIGVPHGRAEAPAMLDGGAIHQATKDHLFTPIGDERLDEIDEGGVHIVGRQCRADAIDVRDCGGGHYGGPKARRTQGERITERRCQRCAMFPEKQAGRACVTVAGSATSTDAPRRRSPR